MKAAKRQRPGRCKRDRFGMVVQADGDDDDAPLYSPRPAVQPHRPQCLPAFVPILFAVPPAQRRARRDLAAALRGVRCCVVDGCRTLAVGALCRAHRAIRGTSEER